MLLTFTLAFNLVTNATSYQIVSAKSHAVLVTCTNSPVKVRATAGTSVYAVALNKAGVSKPSNTILLK